MLTAISITAHKALCVGKRRLCSERELTFAREYVTNLLELLDPHIDPTDSEVKMCERWAVTLECVRDATHPSRSDYGKQQGEGIVSQPVTGEFVTYVWYCLLNEFEVWGAKEGRRIESTGVSADLNYCVQMCLTNGFLKLVQAREGVAPWFVVDPDTSAVTTRSIHIKTPTGAHNEYARAYLRKQDLAHLQCNIETLNKLQQRRSGVFVMDKNTTDLIIPAPDPWSELFEAGTPNNTHVPPELRTSDHEEGPNESVSGSGSDGASQRSTAGKKRNRPADNSNDDYSSSQRA